MLDSVVDLAWERSEFEAGDPVFADVTVDGKDAGDRAYRDVLAACHSSEYRIAGPALTSLV